MRWWISLGLILMSVGPAWADVIFVDPSKAPPKPPGAIGYSLKDSSGKPIQIAIRGRIVNFAPPKTAIQSFFVDYEIAKKVGNAIVFHTPPVRIDFKNIRQITHEVDHPIDLQFLFGNLDEQLIQWKSLDQWKAGLGRPVANIYIKHAMGLLSDAELTVQLTKLKNGPPAISWIPTAKIPNDPTQSGFDSSLPVTREGWLVRLIRDGPISDVPTRRQKIKDDMMTQGLMFPPLMIEPASSSPRPGSPINVDVSGTVRALLKAAAQDAYYGRVAAMAPRGGIGVFLGVKRVTRASVVPKFGTLCLGVVRMLCGLTQYTGTSAVQRRAMEVGIQARRAVIEVLRAACRGNIKGTGDALDLSELDRQIAAIRDPRLRALAMARRRELDQYTQNQNRTQLMVNPDDPGYMPADPSLIALAALKTIQGSEHWRVPAGTDDFQAEPESAGDPALKVEAGYLIKTMVQLAQRPKRGDPRASDHGRQAIITGGSAQMHQDLGVRTRLRDEIEETLCGAAGLLIKDPITGVDTGKHYRPFLTPLLASLEKDFDASFLEYCLAQSGFGSAKQLNKVVNRLFAIALANNKREFAPLPVDRLEARDRRTRAIAVLGRIAALGAPQVSTASGRGTRSRPNSGTRVPTAAEKGAAEMVKTRLTELLAARDRGRANHASDRFFKAIDQMRTAPASLQLNAYDRAALQTRYAQELVNTYAQWVTGDQARRMRELERELETVDQDAEAERHRRLEAERKRLERAAREFGRRFRRNNQSGN